MATSMTPKDRVERITDANLRLEAVVDLASAVANDVFELGDSVDELLDDIADEIMPYHPSMEPLVNVVRAQAGDEQEIGGILFRRDLLGLAVKFATPMRDYAGAGDSYNFSWGVYHTGWVYANTYEEAWELGFEWANAMAAKDREAVS